MYHYNKSEFCVSGHGVKKLLQCLQSSCRGAYAHNRECFVS